MHNACTNVLENSNTQQELSVDTAELLRACNDAVTVILLAKHCTMRHN